MTLKPDVVSQLQVVDQVKGLHEQKYKLETQIEQLTYRHKLIQDSLSENGVLEERVKTLLAESLALFEDEWKRKSEYYPDLWLAAMEQALMAVSPPNKKKPGTKV